MQETTKKILKRVAVGTLSLSSAGLIAITQFEGFSDKVYIPIKGDVPTAGYGHTGPDVDRLPVGTYITKEQALQWLAEDTQEAQDAIQACVKVPLSQQEFDAYVSFTFNVGGSAFCNSTLVKKLNAEDYYGACRELHRWVYAQGRVVKGLEARRKMENLMCIAGEYPNARPD